MAEHIVLEAARIYIVPMHSIAALFLLAALADATRAQHAHLEVRPDPMTDEVGWRCDPIS